MKFTYKVITSVLFFQSSYCLVSAAPDFSLSIHGDVAAGLSDRGHEATGTHGHDPNDDFTVQGIDVGLSVRANESIEGFVNANIFLTQEDDVDGEWEEGFLKFKNLPLGLEVRGGRYLNRLGTENNVHLHGWEYVTASLSTGVFLGEDGLRTDGAELSWEKEYEYGVISISGSYGKAVTHAHDDEHYDEEEHDDEEDDHDEHGHAGESQELAYYGGDLFTVRSQVTYNKTDFYHHKLGASYACGENGYGRDTNLFGADYSFTWRENGLDAGGKEVSAGVEYFYRDVEWVDEDDASNIGADSQNSLAVKASYAWNENWRVGARYEWMDGAHGEVFDIEERERMSLAVTYRREINEDWSSHARVQYNHDKVDGERSNNAYLQLGFSFGGSEVR